MANNRYLPKVTSVLYQDVIKKIFFGIQPEKIHNVMVGFGEQLGKSEIIRNYFSSQFVIKDKSLQQKISGLNFQNPVGLAAGFDYEARLTQILPSIGFGFETVGTITNMPYGGNPSPMLGRLPKSKSLMVNKGFKNLGAKVTIEKLSGYSFRIPLGISIGSTNSKKIISQKDGISDIDKAFIQFEKSRLNHSYYELNISCPNLFTKITFYPPKNLRELLIEIDKLNLTRPVFVKMPIEKSDREILEMLKEISRHKITGVIFGNLQKDRSNKNLVPSEVRKFKVGNFSGKPTFDRSNELIKLAYKNYKGRFVIIGCGGIFSAEDAYKKIRLGASLVQLITGMIFNGPQLIFEINSGLLSLLKRDGFTNINKAIGKDVK